MTTQLHPSPDPSSAAGRDCSGQIESTPARLDQAVAALLDRSANPSTCQSSRASDNGLEAAAREERLRQAQRYGAVPRRHAGFHRWEHLQGPPAYLACVARLREFCERGDSILIVTGPRGTGKTAAAAVAVVETLRRGRTARYTTLCELLADLKDGFGRRRDGEGPWLRRWGELYLLVVDEIAERTPSAYERAMLTTLHDLRYRELRPTLLLGNVRADAIGEVVGPSVADRTREGGGVVTFAGWPSWRGPQATRHCSGGDGANEDSEGAT